MRRRAFTLLELLVVLVLTGLLAAAASFAWRNVAGEAQLESTLESIEFFDRQVRSHARGGQLELQLVFEIGRGRIQATGRGGPAPPLRELWLAGARIGSVRAALHGAFQEVNAIAVSPDGQSATYVVEIQGANGRRAWLLFCGLTGELFRLEQESEIDHVRQVLAPTRPDAA